MRKLRNQQLPLVEGTADHPKAKEFARISEVLDSHHSIYELALQDFDRGINNVGANGMTVEQIIRAAIVMQTEGFSYRSLAFHLDDSRVYRQFCKTGFTKSFKKSTLQKGIKTISTVVVKNNKPLPAPRTATNTATPPSKENGHFFPG